MPAGAATVEVEEAALMRVLLAATHVDSGVSGG
jgi:hypothetical protein